MTQDIDLCLLCGFGNEEKYIDALLKDFKARIPNTHNFALANRVLLLYASKDVSVDITLSGIPFEELMIDRSTPFFFIPEFSLMTCSSEDLVILKAFANRSIDWMDIEGIVMRQGQNLDIDYISAHLTPLCEAKEAPDIVDKLHKTIEKFWR